MSSHNVGRCNHLKTFFFLSPSFLESMQVWLYNLIKSSNEETLNLVTETGKEGWVCIDFLIIVRLVVLWLSVTLSGNGSNHMDNLDQSNWLVVPVQQIKLIAIL